eukprot:10337148-Alexandrium_andersonii.AAC.1
MGSAGLTLCLTSPRRRRASDGLPGLAAVAAVAAAAAARARAAAAGGPAAAVAPGVLAVGVVADLLSACKQSQLVVVALAL